MIFLSLRRSQFLTYVVFLLLRIFFPHFLQGKSSCINSLSFYLYEKTFISPSLMKDNFTGYDHYIIHCSLYTLGSYIFFYFSHFTYFTALNSFSREDSGTPLQYYCLENPMDRGAWWTAVHGVSKSWTRLSNFTFTFHFHSLEKEMATHSSVLARRIPGTGEPGGLPSMGSHRVGHD